MQWFQTREALDRACGGPAMLSKIGVIAKPQGDRVKLRLIHDLRRSGVNSRVKLTGRFVLPRLRDARDGILELIQRYCREWELIGLDFSDAFKQLFVAPRERKYLTLYVLNHNVRD